MAWQSIYSESITEGPLNKSIYQLLDPNEGAHCFVNRTDAGSSEVMFVQLWTSFDDGTTETDVPVAEFAVDPADDAIDFAVQGPYKSIAIGLRLVGGVDAQTADIKIRPNGGLT
jgi:hypothetical protein